MKQDGMTLTELIVVAAILGMVSAMAGPSLMTLHSRMQTRCAIAEIASELRLARQLAITSRDRVRLRFDSEPHAVVAMLGNGTSPHHIYRYVDKGIVIEEPSAGTEVVFYPSGRSATATTIPVRSRDGQVHMLTVSITGRVSAS